VSGDAKETAEGAEAAPAVESDWETGTLAEVTDVDEEDSKVTHWGCSEAACAG
jgi:hypothetical protein